MNVREEEMLEALMLWEPCRVPHDVPAALQSELGQLPPQEKLLD